MTKEIGGYFELELRRGKEYHQEAIALNSGRYCLVYAIKACGIKRLYYPYFNCETMLKALNKLSPELKISFYHIDEHFRPILDLPLQSEDWLLYINYYGICPNIIHTLHNQTIVDNSQSFFMKPNPAHLTFYSPRKFFGVPDGGYLYSQNKITNLIDVGKSFQRAQHLLKRTDLSAAQGYADFQAAEASIAEQPIQKMSRLTQKILASIDYDFISHIRQNNFIYLHNNLSQRNELNGIISQLERKKDFVPFSYPLMVEKGQDLRAKLIDERIYIPKYWPDDMLDKEKLSQIERNFVENILSLPIDQRYQKEDMDRILEVINGKN